MALAAGISGWRGPRSNPFLRDRVAATRGPLFISLMRRARLPNQKPEGLRKGGGELPA
jgi:hypothetical protein